MMTACRINCNVKNLSVKVDGRVVYITPTGVKVGARGRVISAGWLYGTLTKGEARRLRKAIRKAGDSAKAAERREFIPW